MKIDDQLKKSFYEIEFIRANWGSRELRRQIISTIDSIFTDGLYLKFNVTHRI